MSTPYERRIGGRVDVAAIPVGWRLPPPDRRRRARRRGAEPESGLLLDMSVSGLQVRAAAAEELVRGSVVHLSLDGVVGWGRIRRVTPVPGTRSCTYGIELDPESTALVQYVHDRVAGASAVTEDEWR